MSVLCLAKLIPALARDVFTVPAPTVASAAAVTGAQPSRPAAAIGAAA